MPTEYLASPVLPTERDTTMPPPDFATALLRARQRRRLSQTGLFIASGVDRSIISRLESGERAPTADTARALIDGLHGAMALTWEEWWRLHVLAGVMPHPPALLLHPAVIDIVAALANEHTSPQTASALAALVRAAVLHTVGDLATAHQPVPATAAD